MGTFLIALTVAVALNLLFFIPAYIFRTDKLTDISYALTFILLSIGSVLVAGASVVSWIFLGMVLLWAVRLGSFLFIRINKMKRDKRFDKIRNDFMKFGGFWLFQGISVPIILLPGILLISQRPKLWEPVSLFGIILWLIGLVIETLADWQKFNFTLRKSNKGRWIESGLWRYSRHPNYFGEIMIWVGLYVFSAFYLSGVWVVLALASPLYITLLLLFVSGVPQLESKADLKWGDDPAYRRYRRKTSLIIPWPPAK